MHVVEVVADNDPREQRQLLLAIVGECDYQEMRASCVAAQVMSASWRKSLIGVMSPDLNVTTWLPWEHGTSLGVSRLIC